jgi:hypothetical protein
MIIGDMMYTTIKFEGVIDKILEKAVESGLAKTKVEALRISVLELERRYDLLKTEDKFAVKKMRQIDKEIKSGKRKVLSEKEVFGRVL